MRRGYHASPVAYKREGTRPKLVPLRKVRAPKPARKAGPERCPDCGSDSVERHDVTLYCHACQTVQLCQPPKAKPARRGDPIMPCWICGVSLEPGDWYAKGVVDPGDGSLWPVWYCEQHADRNRVGTSRAWRIEQRCERRSRPHDQRRRAQRHLARQAPRGKQRPGSRPKHHAAVIAARRQGYARVDGVWKKVV